MKTIDFESRVAMLHESATLVAEMVHHLPKMKLDAMKRRYDRIRAIEGEAGKVCAVRLSDGRVLPAQLVVFGIGVIPNAEMAAAAGLACPNGVEVDAMMATADPAISAIGDVACFPATPPAVRCGWNRCRTPPIRAGHWPRA